MKLNYFNGYRFHSVTQKFVVTNMCHNKMQSIQHIAELNCRILLTESTGVISNVVEYCLKVFPYKFSIMCAR